jgi:hypothetical protein
MNRIKFFCLAPPLRLCTAAILIGGGSFFAGSHWEHSREFQWQGRTVREWAHEMTAHPVRNREAARHLGPLLVPDLVREIDSFSGFHDGTLAFEWACKAYSLAPVAARRWIPEPVLQSERRLNAIILLEYLGPDAKAAVPKLVSLLDDDTVVGSILTTFRAIGVAARPAVPRLRALVEEPCPYVLSTLLQIDPDTTELRSLAIRAKTNGPPWLRAEAADVLSQIEARDRSNRLAVLPLEQRR